MASSALLQAEALPAGLGGQPEAQVLAEALEIAGVDRYSDLGVRLDDAIERAKLSTGAAADELRRKWHQQLLPTLRPVVAQYDRVSVLLDNLDKTWERGVDFEVMSNFLLQLLVSTGRVRSEIGRSRKGHPSATVTTTTFLRTDIYDVIRSYAREPDKINPQVIQWQDEELLIRVLEERYSANYQGKQNLQKPDLWQDLFCTEVHGMPTRDYFLWRALPRPRDMIFLGNAVLTTAINRRHSLVLSQDFSMAEKSYSRFAIEALLVESEAQGLDLESSIIDFAGSDAIIDSDELLELIADSQEPQALTNWLVQTSFLGLETLDGSFVHVEGEQEARKKLKVAQRLASQQKRPVRFRIHPAFRPYLDIRDTDVHR